MGDIIIYNYTMSKKVIAILLCFSAVFCNQIQIPTCTGSPTPTLKPFRNTITGDPEYATSETSAYMCHDDKYLYIYWWCTDDDIISTYQNCNDPLYNQDAVEIFLASTSSNPHTYYQFQVSPKGVLFFANILNPNLTCYNLGTQYKQCETVSYGATQYPNEKRWQANLKVDLKIVGRGQIPKMLKGNLFRIDKSTSRPTKYLAFNPTLVNPACFHRPTQFVDMILT